MAVSVVDDRAVNLKLPSNIARVRSALPDCCLCVYEFPYDSVSITHQPWDEFSKEITEERSEIEGKMKNVLCHYHREYGQF